MRSAASKPTGYWGGMTAYCQSARAPWPSERRRPPPQHASLPRLVGVWVVSAVDLEDLLPRRPEAGMRHEGRLAGAKAVCAALPLDVGDCLQLPQQLVVWQVVPVAAAALGQVAANSDGIHLSQGSEKQGSPT